MALALGLDSTGELDALSVEQTGQRLVECPRRERLAFRRASLMRSPTFDATRSHLTT
jgi:hypothetical protein